MTLQLPAGDLDKHGCSRCGRVADRATGVRCSRDLGVCFQQLHADAACRAVVLSGAGRLFCAGIDLSDLVSLGSLAMADGDPSRKAFQLHTVIRQFQDWITDLERVSSLVNPQHSHSKGLCHVKEIESYI